MKLTNTRSIKSAKGMTLLELTVVILVLLSLISILFVGARAWKKGADKAASVMVIRNTQQAVRSFANMHGLNPNDTPTALHGDFATGESTLKDALFGAEKFMTQDPTDAAFKHPAGPTYGYTAAAPTIIPPIGTLFITTTIGDTPSDYNPNPTDITSW